MNDDEQANLSLREIAIRTKEKLRELAVKSPQIPYMFGLQVDKWTTFYFSSPERRLSFIHKYGKDFDKVKLISPKKR